MKANKRATTGHGKRWKKDKFVVFRALEKGKLIYSDTMRNVVPEDQSLKLTLPIRIAFEATKFGNGSAHHCDALGVMTEVSLQLAKSLEPKFEETARLARDAMKRCEDRFEHTGMWGFDGPALREIEDCIQLYEEMFRYFSAAQILDAFKECMRRKKQGLVV